MPPSRHRSTWRRPLDRIGPLEVKTIACHHGSVLTGHPRRSYRAPRENAVGDIIDAPFYEMRMPAGAGARH